MGLENFSATKSSYFNGIKTCEIVLLGKLDFRIISTMHLPFMAHTHAC